MLLPRRTRVNFDKRKSLVVLFRTCPIFLSWRQKALLGTDGGPADVRLLRKRRRLHAEKENRRTAEKKKKRSFPLPTGSFRGAGRSSACYFASFFKCVFHSTLPSYTVEQRAVPLCWPTLFALSRTFPPSAFYFPQHESSVDCHRYVFVLTTLKEYFLFIYYSCIGTKILHCGHAF